MRDLTNEYLRQFGTLPTGPARGNPVTDDPLMVYGENWRTLPGWPPGMGVRDWFHPMAAEWEAANDLVQPPAAPVAKDTNRHQP